jgi:uncharacterized membrane protein
MKKYKLDFVFKGSRNYIQGPDIFDAALKKIENDFETIKDIKYSSHDWIKNNADLILDPSYEISNYNSIISFVSDKINHRAIIIDNGEKINKRVDYSEDYIFDNSKLNNNEIELIHIKGFSFSELIVSMNKCYLQSLGFKGKWIVTKLDFFCLNDIKNTYNKNVKICLEKNLKNRLTKSTVYLEKQKIGFIYFTLVSCQV